MITRSTRRQGAQLRRASVDWDRQTASPLGAKASCVVHCFEGDASDLAHQSAQGFAGGDSLGLQAAIHSQKERWAPFIACLRRE